MAHFAKIGLNGKVLQTLYVNDSDTLNSEGVEDEFVGQQYLQQHHNWPAELWIKTSYNTKRGKYYNIDGTLSDDQSKAFRGNYAGVGSIWDEENEIFWPKKSFLSWIKDIENVDWKPPIEKPNLTDEQKSQNVAKTHSWSYSWDETTQTYNLTNEI
jgi:hypothetical protein